MFKPLRTLSLSLIALASACAAAPAPDASAPVGQAATPSGDQPCTSMGCYSGVQIAVEAASASSAAWPAGSYRFAVTLDDKTVTCEGSLPLKDCGDGLSIKCDGEGVMIGESGCALPAEQQMFSDIHLDGEPKHIKINVERDGEVVATADFAPEFKITRPNGPTCEPVCNQATGTLRFVK